MKTTFSNRKGILQIVRIFLIILVNVLMIIPVITGCTDIKKEDDSTVETSTQIITITPQPTKPHALPTVTVAESTATPLYPPLSDITIDVTQIPVQISAIESIGGEYLYREAQVAFSVLHWNGTVFLNLDNIRDNSQQNSDFLIYVDSGSMGTTFEIMPTNFARYFYSNQTTMDYLSCIAGLPKTSAQWIAQFEEYPVLTSMIETGKEYCVLTNEGRIAVVKMIVDSPHSDDQGNLSFSLVVTVYNRIAIELFTPAPTQTAGPSPTPTNRYSERGISDPDQIQKLDDAIQAFINAIVIGDKSAIAHMVNYPIFVQLPPTWETTQINSQSDFIKNYEKIFPEEFAIELAKATLENNVRSYPGTIVLECKDGKVYFTDSGKIDGFY